jgi:hypothetical protein
MSGNNLYGERRRSTSSRDLSQLPHDFEDIGYGHGAHTIAHHLARRVTS